MKKRNVCMFLALVAAVVFTGIYFYFFSMLSAPQDLREVVVQQSDVATVLENATLGWIQLGVFKQESSYADLYTRCEKMGINQLLIALADKKILVVGCSENSAIVLEALNKIQVIGIDFISKSLEVNDEEMLDLISKKQYQKVLEEYVYLP